VHEVSVSWSSEDIDPEDLEDLDSPGSPELFHGGVNA
jgi:hypothetical protein